LSSGPGSFGARLRTQLIEQPVAVAEGLQATLL
jgi:hypothetical protein